MSTIAPRARQGQEKNRCGGRRNLWLRIGGAGPGRFGARGRLLLRSVGFIRGEWCVPTHETSHVPPAAIRRQRCRGARLRGRLVPTARPPGGRRDTGDCPGSGDVHDRPRCRGPLHPPADPNHHPSAAGLRGARSLHGAVWPGPAGGDLRHRGALRPNPVARCQPPSSPPDPGDGGHAPDRRAGVGTWPTGRAASGRPLCRQHLRGRHRLPPGRVSPSPPPRCVGGDNCRRSPEPRGGAVGRRARAARDLDPRRDVPRRGSCCRARAGVGTARSGRARRCLPLGSHGAGCRGGVDAAADAPSRWNDLYLLPDPGRISQRDRDRRCRRRQSSPAAAVARLVSGGARAGDRLGGVVPRGRVA